MACAHGKIRARPFVLPPTPDLSNRDYRILAVLAAGDLLWEAPGERYATQFDERPGRFRKVPLVAVQHLEELHLIERCIQDPAAQRLDYWQLTEKGRAVLAERSARRVGSPAMAD